MPGKREGREGKEGPESEPRRECTESILVVCYSYWNQIGSYVRGLQTMLYITYQYYYIGQEHIRTGDLNKSV